jgi:hypothetical protein
MDPRGLRREVDQATNRPAEAQRSPRIFESEWSFERQLSSRDTNGRPLIEGHARGDARTLIRNGELQRAVVAERNGVPSGPQRHFDEHVAALHARGRGVENTRNGLRRFRAGVVDTTPC